MCAQNLQIATQDLLLDERLERVMIRLEQELDADTAMEQRRTLATAPQTHVASPQKHRQRTCNYIHFNVLQYAGP